MTKRPIFWRMYPSYILLIVISIIALSWMGINSQRRLHLKQMDSDLEARARLVKEQIAERLVSGNEAAIDSLCKELGRVSATRITVVLPSGIVIGDSDEDPARMENHGYRPEIKQALETGSGEQIRYSNTIQQRLMYKAIRFDIGNQLGGVIRTAIPVTFIDQALNETKIRMLIDGLIITLLSALLGLYVSRRISKPLERMKLGAQKFASGDLGRKLHIEGTTIEIDTLAEAMNEMADQLGRRIATITSQNNEQEAIFYSMVEGVIAVDSEAHIIKMNKAAGTFFNLELAQIEGRQLHTVIRSSALQEAIEEVLSNHQPVMTEIVFADIATKTAEVTATVLTGADGSRIGALIVVNDVTRIRQLEKIRRDFVANVSHELKTPVTAIRGFVETLLDGAVDNTDDAHRFLDIIKKQSDRLQAIIEDLLSLARIEQEAEDEKIELSIKPLQSVLRAAKDSCLQSAGAKNISLELSAEDTISARINPRLLEQAVINLITNAITYSQPGGAVKIKANVFGDEVAISVIDYGCGIASEHHERLFERFYRVDKARSRDQGGTGLGLAIVKHIALAHNGSVTVDSVPGEGSTFTIHLPK